MIQTLEWTDQGVRFIDQTKLPTEETYVTCKTHEQVADVIRTMVVRGAPAIGVAAAMGIGLAVKNSKAETAGDLKRDIDQACDLIGKTRPTAVNLFWAIRRMQEKFERIRIRPIPQIKQTLIEEAQRMHAEDIAANQAMGRHGATLMPSEGGVLTHCNAGALATAGYGTALGVIRAAVEQEWLPALDRFRPQMLFISAGFDAHRDDGLAFLRLSDADYPWVTGQVRAVAAKHAGGRIVSLLEGGYDLDVLRRCVAAHLRELTPSGPS